MIVDKRDEYIEKSEITNEIKDLINNLTTNDLNDLASLLNQNLIWNRPRGELFHWIPVLNRFDEIFEKLIDKYNLNDDAPKLKIINDYDSQLIISCLKFTHVLLSNCSDRSIYSSADRVYSLINTPTIDVRLHALEVGILLAKRIAQINVPRFQPPKPTKLKILELAKFYPPLVSVDSALKQLEKSKDDENEKPSIIGDHFNFIDTLNPGKEYPNKWKSINFQFYKSTLAPASKDITSQKVQSESPSKGKKDLKKKSEKEKLVVAEGLQNFVLPEESVKKLNLQQIYDKACDNIPKDSWFLFSLSAQVAKSFNSLDLELREKLIQIKCLAIGITCCIYSNQQVSTKLLEVEPYNFSFLVDAISPETKLKTTKVVDAALIALESISIKRVWGGDIIRCMGGNVSHGTLFQIIRYIHQLVKDNDPSYNEEAYLHYFALLDNLISTKGLIPRLTTGALLIDLMSFINLDTKYKPTCTAAIRLIEIYLPTTSNLIDDFVNNNGFNILIESVGKAVNNVLNNYELTDDTSPVPYQEASYLRQLMKLVSSILNSDQGDRLRNLFDSSLLESFNKIVENPKLFGANILAPTLDSVFFIIHNEPTAYSILNEAKVIDTILNNYENLFLPSSTLLMSLPEVLGAICLNNDGLKKVEEKNAIGVFFRLFRNIKNAKDLVKSDMATNLGCSFDELGRHYPSLKPIILEEIKKMLEDVSEHVEEWFPGMKFYTSENGSLYHNKNQDIPCKVEGEEEIYTWENTEQSYVLDNVLFFLGGLLPDSGQWGAQAMEKIKFEVWAKFLTIKTAPFDYGFSNGISPLMSILKFFDDENRNYGLPVVISRLNEALKVQVVQDYIHYEEERSYFEIIDPSLATELLQNLNVINILLCTISEIYINHGLLFNERIPQIIDLFGGLNIGILTNLSLLLQRSVIEEGIIRLNTPDDILNITFNSDRANSEPPILVYESDPSDNIPQSNGTSAQFKNIFQIRTLNDTFQQHIASILSSITRATTPKRVPHKDGPTKREAIEILLEIGKNYTQAIKKKFSNQTLQQYYTLIISNMILYTLSQKDRSKELVFTPFLSSILQHGFFNKINEIAITLWSDLLAMDQEQVKTTSELKYIKFETSSLIKNCLSQILMIYAKSVNADAISLLSSAKSYFHAGYDNNVDFNLISAILYQTRYYGLELMINLIGSKSQLTDDNYQNIPSPLIEQTVSISKYIFQGKKEINGTEFIPFDIRNISPPSEQFAYLLSLGMNEDQAEHYFQHDLDVKDIAEGKVLDCPEFNFSEEEWKEFADTVKADEVDFSIDFPKFKPTSEIIKERKNVKFVDTWLKIAQLYPKAVATISELFTIYNTEEVVKKLTKFISEFTWPEYNNNDAFSVYLHLLSFLLQDDKAINNPRPIFEKITDILKSGVLSNEAVNKPFFPYLMLLLEQLLIFKDAPVHEETKHESLRSSIKSKPFIMDQDSWIEIFNHLLKINEIEDFKSANGIARVLVLYAKHRDCVEEINKLPILTKLISFIGSGIKDKTILDSLKTSVVLILRYTFETREVLKNYMSYDISQIFNTVRHSRDLNTVLKENTSLVFREPTILTDILSKEVRLENYDGGDFYMNRIPIKRVKPESEESQDVDMEQEDSIKNASEVMNTLLFELMNVIKTDWLSDPKNDEKLKEKEKETKKKKKDLDLFANAKFAYACFLLQTITELLGSYKQAKLDFLTFTKKQSSEERKPRSTALNFFIHQLITTQSLEVSEGISYERRSAVSSITKMALASLLATPVLDDKNGANSKKEDPDLALIRRFFVDLLMKVFKDINNSNTLAQSKYSKLLNLFDMSGLLLSTKFKDAIGSLLNKEATKYDQYFMTKVYVEKQMPQLLTNLIAEFDLNFPDIDKVTKAALKPITVLGKNKVEYQDLFAEEHGENTQDEDDIVPEDVDDREETPDLFKNSTLGMYDVDFDSEEDSYDDDEIEVIEDMDEDDEVDDDDSSELSAIDSNNDDQDIEMEAGSDYDDDSEEGSSLDEIEIIDELDLSSGEGEISSENYGEEDEEAEESEYEEDELDGWIEQFQDGDESVDETDDINHRHPDTNPFGLPAIEDEFGLDSRTSRREPAGYGLVAPEDDESDDNLSDVESRSGFEVRMITPNRGLGSRRDAGFLFRGGADPMSSMAQLERSSPALSHLLDGLFREGNFRGSIEITRDEDMNRGHSTIGRLIENMFQLGQAAKSVNHDSLVHIKSTKDRWNDALKMFYPHDKDELAFRVIPAIINRIEDESITLYKKKKEEAEKIRKEREEKKMKEIEEEKKRKEEEAKQREINADNQPPREPVMVRIGDRDVDISGTEIDPDYIEALPEDMREEVLASYVRERRASATATGTESREIDPDFLDALPNSIREEILQQESMARRYAAFEESRTGFNHNEDEDEEEEEEEDFDMDVDERRGSSAAALLSGGGIGLGAGNIEPRRENRKKNTNKVFFTPLVDKQGISSLVRLLFSPLPINQRENIYQALLYMCHNKQSRIEIMSLMIAVLNDGFTNQRPVQKIYLQIFKGTGAKDKKVFKLPIGATQISIGIQMVEAIDFLLERNSHLRYYLLTEHDNSFIVKKNKQVKDNKFPINYLLTLLDNELVKEDQTFLDLLARVLQVATRPLHILKKETDESNKSPPFTPPTIPDENYRHIIKILTGNECSNLTFRRTISAMQNFSILPNAQKIFSLELSEKASELGNKIIHDLDNLTKDLKLGLGSESKSFLKFSAHSSDQSKLLRILTALDYMFEKEKIKGAKEIEELTQLYNKLALGNLWDALSECLRILEQDSQLNNIANALLPIIEALMVVCKHSKIVELPIKDIMKYEAKKIDFTKEPIEQLFVSFTDEHKKILNQMVRSNPNLMSGPFGMLVRNPRVLEFDNKKNYFDRKLHNDNKRENNKLSISIRRDQVFLDSYRSLFFKSKDEFKNSKLEINFKGEQGIDAGGVTREWYQVLSRQMFNPDYALFTPVVSDETTFHPNRTSYINPEHLSFFKFIGRIIGKAIYDNCFLDCHFSRAVYKRILGTQPSLKDMETLDLEYFKSLMWMLENDITDVITEDFSVETDDYGEHKIIDLIENGRNIPVTEENKFEYVKKVVEYRLQTSVEEQMENFLIGFHEIIPKDLVAIFDEKELELLISGLPDIDVLDWQQHTSYHNYSPSSLQIQWFWRAVKSFDNEERARLLQFSTGTSKVPLNGFKELSGASGTCKFSIHRDYGSVDRLPSSHTCFNQIDLPAYDSYEVLRGSLLMAITEGHEGFGLA
ncbi:unnamed protein product [Candida verbasci]|uniref:HECT-type E3 ubiquitin transferase n=1 Tax=Candida verbasci TaxID=1227364 RepID=A0A9W4TRV3_9ASCO|nr:unnamed protein product [Candida verbasci]